MGLESQRGLLGGTGEGRESGGRWVLMGAIEGYQWQEGGSGTSGGVVGAVGGLSPVFPSHGRGVRCPMAVGVPVTTSAPRCVGPPQRGVPQERSSPKLRHPEANLRLHRLAAAQPVRPRRGHFPWPPPAHAVPQG